MTSPQQGPRVPRRPVLNSSIRSAKIILATTLHFFTKQVQIPPGKKSLTRRQGNLREKISKQTASATKTQKLFTVHRTRINTDLFHPRAARHTSWSMQCRKDDVVLAGSYYFHGSERSTWQETKYPPAHNPCTHIHHTVTEWKLVSGSFKTQLKNVGSS